MKNESRRVSELVSITVLMLLIFFSKNMQAQEMTGIRINHIGYSCNAVKICRLKDPPDQKFQVQTIDDTVTWKTVFTGPLVKEGGYYVGDFSSVTKAADYRILCGTEDQIRRNKALISFPFVIKEDPYAHVCRMMISFFTWQRCGSVKGWAGKCHQDPVPLKGTDRKLDMTGGYHQSGDLRCWAEGISLSLYGLIRFAQREKPHWDTGEIREEIRWGCDYFLKLADESGKLYDCQFVPIGYGPRDYYPTPCNMAAHWNVCALLARASVYFKVSDPDYSKRCLAKAEKIWAFADTNSFFEKPYLPPVEDLPRGTQGARFYFQTFRGSASMLSAQSGAALDLFQASGKKEYEHSAKKTARQFADLQIQEGALKGSFRNAITEKECLGFSDCTYNYALWGPRVFIELIRAFPDDPDLDLWKRSLKEAVELEKRNIVLTGWNAVPVLRSYNNAGSVPRQAVRIESGAIFSASKAAVLPLTSSTNAARISLLLSMSGTVSDRSGGKKGAQFYVDYICGGNPSEMSYITGAGRRQSYHNIFGQFFPSTPYIPGAVSHVLGGEYDMPSAGMLLWAISELKN